MESTLSLTHLVLTNQDFIIVKRIANIATQSGFQGQKLTALIRNTLAVLAVQHWLNIFEIETDFNQSYTAKPLLHLVDEVSDLYLPSLGRLECRPISKGDEVVSIPAETWTDRIGYLVVEISEDLKSIQLLGFTPSVEEESISLNSLQSVEQIFSHFATIKMRAQEASRKKVEIDKFFSSVSKLLQTWVTQAVDQAWEIVDFPVAEPQFMPTRSHMTESESELARIMQNLRSRHNSSDQRRSIIAIGEIAQLANRSEKKQAIDFLAEIIKTTEDESTLWLAAGTLSRLDPNHPQSAYRVQKKLNTILNYFDVSLHLIISLVPTQSQVMAATIEISPSEESQALPENLILTVLAEDNEVIDEISTTSLHKESNSENLLPNFLMISLDLETGTDFKVQVSLDGKKIVENINL